MNSINEVLNYFSPFTKGFNEAAQDFKKLSGTKKALAVGAAILASLATLPILGLGGVAIFRVMVERYTFKPMDPATLDKDGKGTQSEVAAAKVHNQMKEIFEKGGEQSFGELVTRDQRSNYVAMIRAEKKDSPIRVEANKKFLEEAKKAESKALELHEKFKEVCGGEKPTMTEKGVAKSSLPQFRAAVEMAKKEFPNLSSLTFNDEQDAAVARLIQIIMCGEEAQDKPLPENGCCFELVEFEGKRTPAVEYPTKSEGGDESFLEYAVEKLQGNIKGEEREDHLISNIQHAVELFVKDCLSRTMFTFRSGQLYVPLGLRQVNNQNPAVFVEVVNEEFTKYLLDNPDKVKEIIEHYEDSPFMKLLGTEFARRTGGTSKSQAAFDSTVMRELFEKEFRQYSDKKNVQMNMRAVVLNSTMDPAAVRQIADKSGCDPNDVKSLVRLKVIEMMMVMQQGFQLDGNLALVNELSSLENSDGMFLLHCSGRSYELDFSSKDREFGHNDYSRFAFKGVFDIRVTAPDFAFAGIEEEFREGASVAKITTEDETESFTTSHAKRNITSIADIKLSWRAPNSVVDFLASKIDPEILMKEKELNIENIGNTIKAFEEFLKRTEEKSEGVLNISSGIDALTEHVIDVNKELNELGKAVAKLELSLKNLDLEDEDIKTLVAENQKQLESVVYRLIELKKRAESKEEKEKFDTLFNQINGILKLIPEATV